MPKQGHKIGPYTLIRKLGQGSFGGVWLAERRSVIATTQVAVKIPNDDDVNLEAVQHEAVVWSKASGHPNVLPLIEADVYDGTVVIVSEFAPDGSLDSKLKVFENGRPPIKWSLEVISGVLAGLSHLHSRGIVHRDLKPANILFQGDTPRLADFGVSRILRSIQHTATTAGTPCYMAPEAFEGQRSERSDIWSVGVLLYQLIAGHLPFDGGNLPTLWTAISKKEPLPLEGLSDSLRAVIWRSLEKRPQDRFQTAMEMCLELTLTKDGWIEQTIGASDIQRNIEVLPTLVEGSDKHADTTDQFSLIVPPILAVSPDYVIPPKGSGVAEKPLTARAKTTKKLRRPKSTAKSKGSFGDPRVAIDGASTQLDLEQRENMTLVFEEAATLLDSILVDQRIPEIVEAPTGSNELSVDSSKFGAKADREDPVDRPAARSGGLSASKLATLRDAEDEQIYSSLPEERSTDGLVRSAKTTATELAAQNRIRGDSGTDEARSSRNLVSASKLVPDALLVSSRSVRQTRAPRLLAAGAAAVAVLFAIGGFAWYISGSLLHDFVKGEAAASADLLFAAPPGMAFVPGGRFLMGSDNGGGRSHPVHSAEVGSFYMDLTEVTNEEYKKFIDARGYPPPKDWIADTFPTGRERFPVTNVTWHDAKAYAYWAGKRLPTEEEWEFAARGDDGRRYPWGNEWKPGAAIAGVDAIRSVGSSLGKSPFGMVDMVGNVWEWTSSDYRPYPGSKVIEPNLEGQKVIRGGSFDDFTYDVATTKRSPWHPNLEKDYKKTGFRCVVDVRKHSNSTVN